MNEITYIPPHNIDLSRNKDEGQFVINNQNENSYTMKSKRVKEKAIHFFFFMAGISAP